MIKINQNFEFDVAMDADTNVRGYVKEIVIRPKNNSVTPNEIFLDIHAECYPSAMPDFLKKVTLEPLNVSQENYDTIMTEVFNQLGDFINIELGEKLNLLIQQQMQKAEL
ncbi:hypothetical protein ACE193_15130 [Bernardetia sp. OM2101]|uniref:hypothetical protein n=1 Tax=Bernardetia sp. OM2101 TaxID=3344876 RepID=UPI0035D0E631